MPVRSPSVLQSNQSWLIVIDHSTNRLVDYELARLYSCMGNVPKAKEHIELVLTGPYSLLTTGHCYMLLIVVRKYFVGNRQTVGTRSECTQGGALT